MERDTQGSRTGRPPRYGQRITTAIRFDREIHDRLGIAAAERDVSINWLVHKAVEQFLDRLVPVDDMRWTTDDEETNSGT